MLDIKPDMYNETLLAIAADELRKINSCRSTGDKVACVVRFLFHLLGRVMALSFGPIFVVDSCLIVTPFP
jgi:hypothetical protein